MVYLTCGGIYDKGDPPLTYKWPCIMFLLMDLKNSRFLLGDYVCLTSLIKGEAVLNWKYKTRTSHEVKNFMNVSHESLAPKEDLFIISDLKLCNVNYCSTMTAYLWYNILYGKSTNFLFKKPAKFLICGLDIYFKCLN